MGADVGALTARIEAQLSAAVSGSSVSRRRRIPLWDAARRATTGLRAVADLRVELPHAGSLRVAVPDRSDLVVEQVVAVLRTVDEIAARFPRLSVALNRVSFDQAHSDTGDTRWEGLAHGSLGQISLRADSFLERPAHDIDAVEVAAHECWHQLEFDLEARHYRTSVEMRRRIGNHFGVETLEHASQGDRSNAPPERRQALARIWHEVTPYATKGPKETTAELFALWWTRPADARTPVLDLFDRVLTELVVPAQR